VNATPSRGRPRAGEPDRVRRDILEVARREFVENGLSGANINLIAERTATSKRMIYYYFTDKEGLYRSVLEDTYKRIRAFEQSLDLTALSPREALKKLVGFTFDYHANDIDHVRLVMIENVHHAKYLRQLGQLREINLPSIDVVRDIYRRGVAEGVFRAGLDPIDIHLTINGLSFFNVSNRASIEQVLRHDMAAPDALASRRESIVETILRFVALTTDQGIAE
jgi:AcrR family transcriptional regulator